MAATGAVSYSGPALANHIEGTGADEEDGTATFAVDFATGTSTRTIETATLARDRRIAGATVSGKDLVIDVTGTVATGDAIDSSVVGRFYDDAGSVLFGNGTDDVPSRCNFECSVGPIRFHTGTDQPAAR